MAPGQPKKCKRCGFEFNIGDNYIFHLIDCSPKPFLHYLYAYTLGMDIQRRYEFEHFFFEIEEE